MVYVKPRRKRYRKEDGGPVKQYNAAEMLLINGVMRKHNFALVTEAVDYIRAHYPKALSQ